MNISTTYETVVTRKGQITLPAEVRHTLGLKRADRVQVSVRGDTVQLRRQPTSRLGSLRHRAGSPDDTHPAAGTTGLPPHGGGQRWEGGCHRLGHASSLSRYQHLDAVLHPR